MTENLDTLVRGCSREDCPVNQGGACIEDYERPEECPNAKIQESVPAKPREATRSINLGAGLTLGDVSRISLDRDINTVSIVGAGHSGKTTFVAMLFYQFLKSHSGFKGYRFMDSESFLALNQKWHFADIRSQSKPDDPAVSMPRSSLDEDPVFHFKTMATDGATRETLWIDIPGEAMEEMLSKKLSAWNQFKPLGRSTHILTFLDLQVMSDPRKRGPHIQQAFDTIANSIATSTWNNKRLMFAFSKADKFESKLKKEIKDLQDRALARFKDDFSTVEFCELHSLGSKAKSKETIGTIWDWAHG